MNRFKELKVWQNSMDIAVSIYNLTNHFQSDEKFGLTSQIRRCAISISSNMAEGAGRNNKKEFNQFLGISIGSSFELESQLLVSSKLGHCTADQSEKLTMELNHIQNMLYKLQKTLL